MQYQGRETLESMSIGAVEYLLMIHLHLTFLIFDIILLEYCYHVYQLSIHKAYTPE